MPITTAPPHSATRHHIGAIALDSRAPGAVAGFEVRVARTSGCGESMSAQDRTWPGLMRRAGRAHLGIWGLEGLADTVELLMSELVTNGFQHGSGDTVGVRLWRTETYLCVEVSSGGGEGTPCPREAGPLEESGRGLGLVAVLADAWGATPDGARTWCLLAVAAAPAGGGAR
ncbi:ATP-binding protein [Streptomyces sp. NPDC014894]|uniref:ATP-binding protein n=1 Tax=Streptomyces sp. NPDC014894 TaxID=3364931 RepID=UPI003701940B